jgi:hypothetical protein
MSSSSQWDVGHASIGALGQRIYFIVQSPEKRAKRQLRLAAERAHEGEQRGNVGIDPSQPVQRRVREGHSQLFQSII